ncbi:MAG TPA: hypothetical protein VH682_18160 [Gemmataceae bacterium]
MFRSLWIHKLLGLSRSRSSRRRQAAQSRRFIRPGLEGLEDRITPSGGPVTVTAATTTDLVKDINDFNSGKFSDGLIINLSGSNYKLPSAQQITNASGLTIEGKDSGSTFITAGPQSRAFDITNGVSVTFEDLTIQGGNVAQTIASHSGGGAIRDIGGDVTLSGVTIQNNTVTSGVTPPAQGGGIFVSHAGSLTIQANSVIQNNNALGSTPFLHLADAQGGGVFVTGGSTLSIDSSSITGNLARGSSGKDAAGGGVYANGSQVSITNTIISDNIAQGGTGINPCGRGGDASGGGLYLKDDSGIASMDLTGNTLSGNAAFAGNGGPAGKINGQSDPGGDGGDAVGGGVYLTNGESNVDFTGTSFSKNTALGGNGGNSTSAGTDGGHGGSASGGGLYLSLRDGTHIVTLAQVVFTSNDAQAGSGGNGADATTAGGRGGDGGNGGLATGGGAYLFGHGTVNMIGASLSENTATGGNGGNGGNGGTGTTGGKGGNGGDAHHGEGGGIFTSRVNLAITNSAFVSNTATGGNGGNGGNGGTGGLKGGDAGSGGDGAKGAGGAIYYYSGHLTLLNTTIAQNTAQGGNGGAGGIGGAGGVNGNGDDGKDGDGDVGLGGGIYDDANGDDGKLFNDTIAFNQALGGTGGNVQTVDGFTGLGGGYFNANDGLFSNFFAKGPTVQNTLFQDNLAADGPDFSGVIGQFLNVGSESNNFFSSIEGIRFPNRSAFPTFNPNGTPNSSDIVSTVPQLGALTPDAATGLSYFPLLASSKAIDAGTITTLPAIAAAQGVTPPTNATDEINNPRLVGNAIDIGAIEFFAATTTTTVDPVTITQSSSPTQIQLTANVSGDTVNEGVVAFSVKDTGGNLLGTIPNVSVVNGVATTSFTVPGNTPAGPYTITADYTDPGGRFPSSTGTGTLTINATGTGTTVTPGNATVTEKSSSQTTGVGVLVTSPSGTVTEGTVTVTLLNNGSAVGTPVSATVSGGAAMVTGLTVPANFPPGQYQLLEAYHDSAAKFGDSQAFGQLTVQSSSSTPITTTGPVTVTGPINAGGVSAGGVSAGAVSSQGPVNITNTGPDIFTAAFAIAIDTAELVLVSHGIFSVGGVPLPSASLLMAQIQANMAFADGLGFAAMQAGMQAANQALSLSGQ